MQVKSEVLYIYYWIWQENTALKCHVEDAFTVAHTIYYHTLPYVTINTCCALLFINNIHQNILILLLCIYHLQNQGLICVTGIQLFSMCSCPFLSYWLLQKLCAAVKQEFFQGSVLGQIFSFELEIGSMNYSNLVGFLMT